MDSEKRKLIVREIEHWRRSKFLPEQYCDFLLNLYRDQETEPEPKVFGVSKSSIVGSSWKKWMLVLASAAVTTYFVLHFNTFQFPMQIGTCVAFMLVCYLFSFLKRSRSPITANVLAGIGSVLALFAGIKLVEEASLSEAVSLPLMISACSLLWMAVGLAGRMGLFHFCGWAGLAVTYAYFLDKHMVSFSWLQVELAWVPIGAIMLWIGWLLQHRTKPVASVLFLAGGLYEFAPELYAAVYSSEGASAVLAVLLAVKIGVAGILLYTTRKTWIEWVAS
ncbi:hypothetical protein [Paenibacillus sp. y28]|uniref:hypothetical protein n=1 Tax=Paenibacillus sp. y28 TaxID=3129110 RepID=UPI0030198032